IISEDQPDSALLSIAISALKIANHYKGSFATMGVLAMECERIIVEYGPLWLRNAHNKSLDSTLVFETLVHIPEDLDSLSELLEIVKIAITPQNEDIAHICQIMIVQANAQALIAETFLESMDMLEVEGAPWDAAEEEAPEIEAFIAEQALQAGGYTNNVIPFPQIGAMH
ncbi:MAG: hypothetical protein ACRBCT_09910, partial [Alphaproteobacteria bacterium]